MASYDHISDSEGSASDAMHTQEPEGKTLGDIVVSPPRSPLSHRFRKLPPKSSNAKDHHKVSVMVAGPSRPWEYQPYRGDVTVDTVLEEISGPPGTTWYKIEFEDGHVADVSITHCSFINESSCRVSCEEIHDEVIRSLGWAFCYVSGIRESTPLIFINFDDRDHDRLLALKLIWP